MKTLFTNVTAVTMDPASPVLKDAFVAVEGMKIASVGTQRPAGDFDRVVDCGATAGAVTCTPGSMSIFSPLRAGGPTGPSPPPLSWGWRR